jgi:serine/threonine protein kinase
MEVSGATSPSSKRGTMPEKTTPSSAETEAASRTTTGQRINAHPLKRNVDVSEMVARALADSQEMQKWRIEPSELLIDKEIGRGSYGVVFSGYWRGGLAAVKKIERTSGLDKEAIDALMNEIRFMKNLRPHGK